MLPCAVQCVVRTFLHCTVPLRAQNSTSGFLRAALRAVHGEQAGKHRDEIRVFPVGALCVWNAHYALVSSLTYTHTLTHAIVVLFFLLPLSYSNLYSPIDETDSILIGTVLSGKLKK